MWLSLSDCVYLVEKSYFTSRDGFKYKVFNIVNCVYYQGGFQEPDVLELNCTSLTKTSDIFTKVLKFKANAIVD